MSDGRKRSETAKKLAREQWYLKAPLDLIDDLPTSSRAAEVKTALAMVDREREMREELRAEVERLREALGAVHMVAGRFMGRSHSGFEYEEISEALAVALQELSTIRRRASRALDDHHRPFVVVKMLSGTWNVRDERTGEWERAEVGLSKPDAQCLADRLNAAASREEDADA